MTMPQIDVGPRSPDIRDASQATYLLDRHMFALWTWSGGAVGAAPPVGDVETVALVVPTSDLSEFEVTDVDCVLIEPNELTGALLETPGRSVDAWRSRIAGGDSVLPIAGHAVPDITGTGVASAQHAESVFRRTADVAAELRAVLAAELRPYQVRGVSWLRETVDAHGGAVLADEMGSAKHSRRSVISSAAPMRGHRWWCAPRRWWGTGRTRSHGLHPTYRRPPGAEGHWGPWTARRLC